MRLRVLDEALSVCKLADTAAIDLAVRPTFVGVTEGEVSLVCPTASVPAPDRLVARDDGWRALEVAGPLDFSLVGILADLSSTLAAARVGIFAVSTYDTDYILVREADLARATAALVAAGHEVEAG